MKLFMDTSAFLSLLDDQDFCNSEAWAIWDRLPEMEAELVCTNYVVVETTALIQNRLGLAAVRDFQALFAPLLQLVWVDPALHGMGMEMMLAADRRRLSLVDCVSFAAMRQRGVSHYFAFDEHFAEQGFVSMASP